MLAGEGVPGSETLPEAVQAPRARERPIDQLAAKPDRICPSPPTARVEGTSGWPTLYGKTDRRTDHPLQNRAPPNHFRTTERLCAR
jgi:hypothetical protein